MEKIDKKDKKIICLLSENCRQGFSSIAKKVGLSKNTIAYRTERLLKSKIIDKFIPMVSLANLGLNTFDLLIKLKARPEEETDVVKLLASHKNTIWLEKLSGEWDLLLEIVAKNVAELGTVLEDIIEKIGQNLDSYEMHIDLKTIKVVPIIEEFVKDAEIKMEVHNTKFTEEIKIDEVDKKILYSLSEDALKPLHELAKELNLTAEAIRYRMKNLEKKGVISTYAAVVDMTKIGYLNYLTIIDLRNTTRKDIELIKNYLRYNKNVQYAFRGATRLEILFYATVKTPEEMDRVIKEIKNEFFQYIQNIRFIRAIDTVKFTLFPEALLEL
jgi:Lrp/AsnC family leucine-responsive transcriptional regulator